MSTLNNNTNSIDKFSSTFDNVFGDNIKTQTREIELDYLTGSGAPPNVATTDLRKVEVKQSTNDDIISTSNNDNVVSNSKGSRTARYHAIKDAKQHQILQLDKQAATTTKQLPEDTTQRRDETIKSTKVVHKQLFNPEKTIQQQLFKPEIEDYDIGNTIELESTADIEVDENTNLIILQQSQSGGIKSASSVESDNNINIEGLANVETKEITNNVAEDIKSRENGPRPRRNPKGIRWNGWFVDNNRGGGRGRGGSSGRGRGGGVSRWIDSGKLDVDNDGIDDRDELGDYEIEGSISRDVKDELALDEEGRVEEEREKVDERMLPRNVGDNAW